MPDITPKILPNSLLSDAITTIQHLALDSVIDAEEIWTGRTERAFLVRKGPQVPAEIVRFPVEIYDRDHELFSLDGLIAYLTELRSTLQPVVFVGKDAIVAPLQYPTTDPSSVRVALALSEEYAALQKLTSGVTQKQLWRLLTTDLHGCIGQPPTDAAPFAPDLSLALDVAGLQADSRNVSEIQIDRTGVTNRAGSSRLTLNIIDSVNGSRPWNVQTEWAWRGRIWDCFNAEVLIHLTLEIIETERGLLFQFHPRRLQSVLRCARTELVGHLRVELKDVCLVYDGEIDSDS